MKPSEESLRIKTKPPWAVKVDNLKTKETLYKKEIEQCQHIMNTKMLKG